MPEAQVAASLLRRATLRLPVMKHIEHWLGPCPNTPRRQQWINAAGAIDQYHTAYPDPLTQPPQPGDDAHRYAYDRTRHAINTYRQPEPPRVEHAHRIEHEGLRISR